MYMFFDTIWSIKTLLLLHCNCIDTKQWSILVFTYSASRVRLIIVGEVELLIIFLTLVKLYCLGIENGLSVFFPIYYPTIFVELTKQQKVQLV